MTFRRFRPHLERLEERWRGTTAVPKPPPGSEPVIKLDSNENPYPPQIDLTEIATRLHPNRYPDSDMDSLRRELGESLDVDPDRIVIGNGCDELIDLLIRITVEPGEAILNCPPTFIMYQRFAEIFGAEVMEVPRNRDYRIQPREIRSAIENHPEIRLVFLCSPNNPTGTLVTKEELEMLPELPVWVVVDETYYNFSGETFLNKETSSDRMVVVRSFSKGFGLAGLRIGYGVFPPDLAGIMRKVRPPYSVNQLAQEAALETLRHPERWEPLTRSILSERERIYKVLSDNNRLRPFPSSANFIFCETTQEFARSLKEALDRERVSVRFLSSPYAEAAFRVSIGTEHENNRFLAALEKASS